jgi:transposase, IS30 family
LTAAEREEISRGVAADEGVRALARRLGRRRRRSVASWRATAAGGATARGPPTLPPIAVRSGPKPCKLSQNDRLRAAVERGLERRWSP